ncbi:MAG: ABC transporter permease [Candidatus Woesearchaeota archaeon]|nr:ABC transporter permease [Candidatus Woesearchaeota archaeon]
MNELSKNFKILFRNISSLLLLVVGPLVLILLIGFTYSGEGIHDIRIGVVSSDYEKLQGAFANFTYAEVVKYDTAEGCMNDLAKQNNHICLEFSDSFMGGEVPSGTIVFYFDNSRKVISSKIVDTISSYFGVQAEKVSIESAQTLFSNIQNIVVYIDSKNDDIFVLVNESINTREQILKRRERLIELRDDFTPVYLDVIMIQSRMDNLSSDLDMNYEDYNESLSEMTHEIDMLEAELNSLYPLLPPAYYYNGSFHNLSYILENNLTSINLSSYNYTLMNGSISIPSLNLSLEPQAVILMPLVLDSLNSFKSSLAAFDNKTYEHYETIRAQKKELDKAVNLITSIKIMIDSDIDSSAVYAEKIDIATQKMIVTQKELNDSLKDLKKLDPAYAEKLVKPILRNYEPLLPDLENIKIAFPGMLAIIIIFISILFANIITLSEINSKAFSRNLITPTNKLRFIFGLVLTNLLVVLFQISVLCLIAHFGFRIDMIPSIVPFLILVILMVMIFTCLGMITALLLRNEQSSILTTTFMALGFFLFSDSVTPLETMPKLATFLASYNPFVIAAAAFRKLLIFNLNFIWSEMWLLLMYLCVLLIGLTFLSKKNLQ